MRSDIQKYRFHNTCTLTKIAPRFNPELQSCNIHFGPTGGTGGRADTSSVCRRGARTPIGASGNIFHFPSFSLYNNTTVRISCDHEFKGSCSNPRALTLLRETKQNNNIDADMRKGSDAQTLSAEIKIDSGTFMHAALIFSLIHFFKLKYDIYFAIWSFNCTD